MSAIDLLSDMIAHDATWPYEAAQAGRGYECLVTAGFVSSEGVVGSVLCEECDDTHESAVWFHEGKYGYFCDQVGFVSVDRSRFVGLLPDVQALVASIASLLKCKNRKPTPIYGKTFRIGALETDTGDLTVYFHPRLQNEDDLSELNTALTRGARSTYSLVLTAAGTLTWGHAKTARLSEVFEIDEETGSLHTNADLYTLAGVTLKRGAGRPKKYAEKVLNIVWERSHNGIAIGGLNAEARTIVQEFSKRYPDEECPSESTIRREIRKFRAGSKVGQN